MDTVGRAAPLRRPTPLDEVDAELASGAAGPSLTDRAGPDRVDTTPEAVYVHATVPLSPEVFP
jgi:hypothetical protein